MPFELSYDELDSYLQQVCSGEKISYILDQNDREVPVLLRYPREADKRYAELVYRQSLTLAEKEGLPSIKEMEQVIRDRGIFTQEDEDAIEKLQSRIKGQRSILAKTTRVPARRDRLSDNIKTLQKEIDKIASKKEVGLEMTRERKAAEEKFLYLTSKGSFDPSTGNLFWQTEEHFKEESDFLFRKRVFVEYIFLVHGLSQEIIRFTARSNLWRIRYVTATKTGDSLFGLPISEYNVDQLTLMYWSHFYQSIYEMMPDERPSENIIDDDQALDAYMKDWYADRNRDAAASKAKSGKQYGQGSAWDHGETLVMQSNPMHADIEYSKTLVERSDMAKKGSVDAAPIGRNSKKQNPLAKGKR